MENNQVEQELNEKTDNRFGYKLKGATLDKKSGVCYAEIFYNDGVILTSKDKQISEELLLSLLPKGFSYEFKFIKNFVANEAVIDFINQYFKKNHPSIHFSIKKADCEGAEKKVIISVDEQVSKYVSERGIDKELKACIKENFSVWVEVLFETTVEVAQDYEDTDEIDLQSFMPALPDRYIEVSEVEPLVGNLTDNLAYYIKDKTVPEEEAVVCGKVLFIKEYSYQPKTKDKKTDKVEQKTEANEQSKAEETKLMTLR